MLLGTVVVFGPAMPWARADYVVPTAPKERRKREPLPPQAIPATAKVAPGGIVQIPLKIYGRQGQSVTYATRKDPQLGKVLGIKEVDLAISVLIYQHTAPMTGEGDQHDRLLFVAQDRNGTSAPAEIDIAIVDDPPLLAAPNAVDFGELTLGGTGTRTITVANRGGRVMEGDFSIEGPWTIDPPHFHLARHEEARFQVSLVAASEQEYRGVIRFPGFPHETVLHATGFAPVTVTPRELDLIFTTVGGQRSGNMTLSNRTNVDRAVRITANARLHLPEEIVVPANGTNTVSAALATDDPAGFNEPVEFRTGQAVQSIKVHAGAILPPGAWLRVAPKALDFGAVNTGHPKSLRLRVDNGSDTGADLTATVPPPFEVDRGSFSIEPGKGAELVVTLKPAWPGRLSAVLKVHAADAEVLLPLSAEVTSRIFPGGTISKTPESSAVTVRTNGVNPAAAALLLPKHWSGIPAVGMIEVDRVKVGTADLSWSPPGNAKVNAALNYRIEVRRLTVDNTGALHVVWIPLPTVKYTKAPDRVRAYLSEIPPGIGVTLRVVSETPRGNESEPSSPVQFFVPAKAVIFTVQRLLLALFTLVLLGALWVRKQLNVPMRRE